MKRSELLRHIAENEDNGDYAFSGLLFDGKECSLPPNHYWFAVTETPLSFTLKPRTHKVNGFEVPAPMTEAGDYWLVHIEGAKCLGLFNWNNHPTDQHCIKYGLCFATKEHAELNRKAQLGINPYGEGE